MHDFLSLSLSLSLSIASATDFENFSIFSRLADEQNGQTGRRSFAGKFHLGDTHSVKLGISRDFAVDGVATS